MVGSSSHDAVSGSPGRVPVTGHLVEPGTACELDGPTGRSPEPGAPGSEVQDQGQIQGPIQGQEQGRSQRQDEGIIRPDR